MYQVVQYLVPAGVWFGAQLSPAQTDNETRFALVGCTVAPVGAVTCVLNPFSSVCIVFYSSGVSF